MSCSLHDAARFEALGIPTVVVATDAFVRPADEQLAALNFGAYRPYVVFIPHPLASLSRPEVDAKADAALAEVLGALTDGAAGVDGAVATPLDREPEEEDPRLSYKPVRFQPLARLDAEDCET